MATSFRIPGNIKQQYLPFVLDPKANINSNVNASDKLRDKATPQYFSFREKKLKRKVGLLTIFPSTFLTYMKKDISNLLTYIDKTNTNLNKTNYKSITYADLFNLLPGILIREFLPDTKLDQCINFFGDILAEVKNIWTLNKDDEKAALNNAKKGKDGKNIELTEVLKNKIKEENSAGFFTKFKAILWHAFDYLTGTSYPNIYSDIGEDSPRSSYKLKNDGIDRLVLDWPYTLYYTLLSCVTTNLYELPCKTEDNLIIKSDGKTGWPVGTDIGISGLLSKIPGIGTVLNSILGNIRINYMPWWDSSKGSLTAAPEITIKFNLFNDTADAAMQNFIFVNTIVPNNMWILYGMFLHSPCLYDVKIEGYNRLFICAATFAVNGLGVLRTPSKKWVKDLVNIHGNVKKGKDEKTHGNINKHLLMLNIINNNLIKIPDVYQVTMTFTSLLPANFNNFLFTYSLNNNIDTDYHNKKRTYLSSLFAKVVAGFTVGFTSNMIDYINGTLKNLYGVSQMFADIAAAKAEEEKAK